MAYRNRPGNTQQARDINVFFVGVALDPDEAISGVVLPDVSETARQGEPALHVFAIAIG